MSDAGALRQAVLETIEAVAPGADAARLRTDLPLRGQLDLDSLEWLSMLTGLEERLGIVIPASEHGRLGTLDALLAYLASAQAGPPAAPTPPAGAVRATQHEVDGRVVTLRPLRAEDASLEVDLVRRLSPESRYQRFMVTLRELPAKKLAQLTQVDQHDHVALVATVANEGREAIAGVARYVVDDTGSACEFAIVLDDAWHGSGLAGLLMRSLMDSARSRGLRTINGIVLASNRGMLKLARQLGFERRSDPQDRSLVCVQRRL